MPITIKELKDDAVLNIPVNKPFYLMTKALSFYLFQDIGKTKDPDAYLKEILTKKYEELDDLQRSFYTVALLLAQIESQAKSEDKYTEKEVLQPGDEGYVEPTVG
jgi:hypothetical protein